MPVDPPPLNGLFLDVNSLAGHTPWLHVPMALVAVYGLGLFAVLIVIAWWSARAHGPAAMARVLAVPLAAVTAVALQQVVDQLVDEPRPYAVYRGITVLIGRSTDPSFPSDHACIVGAVAATLFLVDRRLGWIAAAGALLMAFARVYVGVHWPLDVIVGLAFGASVALLVAALLQRPLTAVVHWLSRTRCRRWVSTTA